MLLDIPFWQRIVLLAAIFAVLAVWDYRRIRAEAIRWKEYLFLFGMGGLVALIGLVHDQATLTVSPEYYAIGKGLATENLRGQTAILGMKAGFGAGAVIGGILLVANPDRRIFRLFGCLKWIVPCALAFSILGAIAGHVAHGRGWRYVMDVNANWRLLLVWGWHSGLYVGTAVGTVAACVRVRRHGIAQEPSLR